MTPGGTFKINQLLHKGFWPFESFFFFFALLRNVIYSCFVRRCSQSHEINHKIFKTFLAQKIKKLRIINTSTLKCAALTYTLINSTRWITIVIINKGGNWTRLIACMVINSSCELSCCSISLKGQETEMKSHKPLCNLSYDTFAGHFGRRWVNDKLLHYKWNN